MEITSLEPVTLAPSFNKTGSVSRERVDERTRELAVLSGRVPPWIVQTEYEQAKREVTGESDSGRQDALLDAIPPAVPGLAGRP